MDTSQTDDALVRHPVVLRVLVVAGALFGFTVLALLASGAAHASEGSPPPDRPGLLDRTGDTVHDALKPVEPVLKPVTGGLYAVSSQVAPVVKPVTSGLEPVIAPVTRPVFRAAEPVLSALRPVTRPVLHALSPVTSPVLRAAAPVTAPLVRAVGAESAVPVVTGQPAQPKPREDISAPPAAVGPAGRTGPVVADRGTAQRGPVLRDVSRQFSGYVVSDVAGLAGPMSGSGGAGLPADAHGVSGAMSAGSGGQHGGEYAVTAAGSRARGTDRAWRAPPGGPPSLYWVVFYGNDHPS